MKKKRSKTGPVIAAVAVVGLLFWGSSALAATDVPIKPWMPGPGGKGKIYTGGGGRGGKGGELPKNLPTTFDYGGNGLYIDPNCEYVIEGNFFWPANPDKAYEAETLEAVMGLHPENTILGYVDYLTNTLDYKQPEQVAWKILEEASPMCAAVDPSQWGRGLQAWYDTFVARLSEYMEDYGISFGPSAEQFDDGPHLDEWED